MNRIFPVLAWFALAFLVATMLLGMSLGDLGPQADEATKHWATVHRLSGVAAALVVLLVDSIVITYFIGTSRWCKEVVAAYSLDHELFLRSTRLKRKTFPYATLSMLAVVGIVALGGAADPGAALRLPPIGGITWANLHLAGSLLGIAFIAFAFWIEWVQIEAQREVIEDVLAEVRRIRQEKGLEVP